jgi:signal transduction histidine kinase/DNA-binding NarL/FixJ family response regulator
MAQRSLSQELAEALEQQRVTSEILRVIAVSSVDPGPVFETIVTNAARLCEANFAFVMLNEGGRMMLAARTACSPEFAQFLKGGKPPNRATTTGRAALERRPVQVLDFLAEPEAVITQAHRTENVRTVLAVPMCRDDRLLGVISVWRREVRPFSEKQIKLLETFADQAVIAIENVRLFQELQERNRELAEALEQQTATSEVLKVISRSSFDLEPVLQTLIEYGTKLCGADQGFIFRRDDEGYRLAAALRSPPEFTEWRRANMIRPGDGSIVGRVALEGRTVQIIDAQGDREWLDANRDVAGIGVVRTLLGVPMLREGVPIGVIAMWRTVVRPFTVKQFELIAIFADQAVIAIENVRLFQELQTRNRELTEALEQQTATAEILRAISGSPNDALPVFEAIVRNAVALCGSLFANVFSFDGELLHYVASTGPTIYAQLLRTKYPMRPDVSQVSGRVLLGKSVVTLEDARADLDYDQRFPDALGWRRMLGVPMLREGKALGVIVVGWAESGPVSKVQIELLKTFADQAVIAIENVRLFNEIQDKTRQLELANTYKSRFLAAASHDLRQPLHALNLFVAQLQAESDPAERKRLVARVDVAVSAMNELFNALLDMSKLEAGMLDVSLTEFPVERLFKQMETTFADAAREKGLWLRIVPSGAWIRSDFILLERILLNLVSNAVRYTARGGIVIGCRRRGKLVRLDIWDSGMGIPEKDQQDIFREFYQLAGPEIPHQGGLGLGLAIVDRLGRLLDHPVELTSRPGIGSRFSVSVPTAVKRKRPSAKTPAPPKTITDPVSEKLIVVIDDDALVLDGMQGLLRNWGCRVVCAETANAALTRLAEFGQQPDLIISDHRLADGKTGIEAIDRLRGTLGIAIPAFLISGDTGPERLRDARASGYHLLHKPVTPMKLRAMLNRLLKTRHYSCDTPRKLGT